LISQISRFTLPKRKIPIPAHSAWPPLTILWSYRAIYVAFPIQDGLNGKKFPVVYPASGDARKEISNRILATYVVNHCVDDYEA
jgi:hypothetical protein